MLEAAYIIFHTQIAIFILFVLLAFIYLIPIVLIRRFHNVNNVFTVNLCFATICCGMYWLIAIIISRLHPEIFSNHTITVIISYFETMCTLQVPYAAVGVSVYRFFAVVYHTKAFARKKKWIIICIISQWMIGIIISLPRPFVLNSISETTPFWIKLYGFLVVVIIPSLSCLIINIIIFRHVRSSTNRVHSSSVREKSNSHQHINRRDLHLLRHMIIMFCIFVVGWSPIYLFSFITFEQFEVLPYLICMLLAELSVTLIIVNLFLYNHELRRYLTEKFFKC